MHTLVVGAGFSGLQIALQAKGFGTVCGTRRESAALVDLRRIGVETLALSGFEPGCDLTAEQNPLNDDLQRQLAKVTHLVICSAPDRQAPLHDPVLRLFTHESIQMPMLKWIGYLSTIGVYGDHKGQWVDESTPCSSIQSRSIMRREAELGWLTLAEYHHVPLTILRLSGIYGVGRNAVKDALAGRERILTKPDQVFNRIHIEDLATATLKAANQQYHGILNITDDLPTPPEEIVAYAHYLVGKPCPPQVNVDSVEISEMARSFYDESKRVSNALSKQVLEMSYKYPTYREGLDSIWAILKS